MKTSTPVNKTISLSMMLTLGLMMANGAVAAAQHRKECIRGNRGEPGDTQKNAVSPKHTPS